MAAALSDDEGVTWKWQRHIGHAVAKEKSFAYPSLIQTGDDNFHLTYSYTENGKACIQHVVFDTDWIKRGE